MVIFLSGVFHAGAQRVSARPQQMADRGAESTATASQKRMGDEACLPCHEQYSKEYRHTAHHLTSQLAGPESVLGPFTGSASKLVILEPDARRNLPGLSFEMEIKEGGYYVTAVASAAGLQQSHSARVDVVTGSGKRGQSYLYWLGDQLFELPLSYWTEGHQWINSPGFKDQTANFSRPIYPRCLECHATDIVSLSKDPLANHYVRDTLVVGIACETCHGQAAVHVASHSAQRPTESKAADKTIFNPARFSRDRQVDLCALCHSGAGRTERHPAFSYVPGEPLDGYLQPALTNTAIQPEVHGNQVGLLKRSRCYLSSPSMSCSTCHNVHTADQPVAEFSSRCLGCHKVESCNMSKTLGPAIAADCIDCHMPEQPTNAIVAKTAGKVVRATMRTHWIRVYPAAAQP